VVAQSVRFLPRKTDVPSGTSGAEDAVPPEETTDLEPF
jgi:hypothetical protein